MIIIINAYILIDSKRHIRDIRDISDIRDILLTIIDIIDLIDIAYLIIFHKYISKIYKNWLAYKDYILYRYNRHW